MGVPPMKHGQDARATTTGKGFARTSYGYVFGSMSGGMPDFHITDFTTGSPTAMIWHPNEWSTTAVRQGRTYLDGVHIDGTALPPKRGWQLLAVAMADKLSQAANFFNDRGIMSSGKRAGGDNLCEVAVFTNRLSETERMLVQSYLMQKWLGTKAQIPPTVHASASGTVIADVAESNTLALRLNGDGTLLKQGAGLAILEATPASSSIFRSAVVQSGTLDARLPVSLSLTAGDRVATSNTAISVTQDAGAGQLAKDGPGTVTLSSVPDGVTQINVNGGTVVLATPAVSVSVTAVITGSVPNATFEAEQLTSDNRRIADGETYHGWTAHVPPPYPGADNAVFIFNRQRAAEASKWPCDYDAPEGLQVLALKQDASVSTSLSLPVAGIYDVSFYTSARSFRTGRHEIDLCLVEGATTNAVTTVQTVNQAYARQSFRLPWLETGTHTLLFHRNVAAVDTLGTIDDIKVTLVSTVNPNTVKIPNGDFELTDYPRDPTTFTTSNVARGWTFTAVTNGEISAGITMPASSVYAYTPSTPYGVVMLCLASNGCARSASFALPAGTYALQGAVCKWPCRIGNKYLQATQSIKATVARATGDSIELGTLETSGSILTTRRWPTAFTVTDNETITLTLAGTGTSGVGLIDNLELIPQTSSIIQNGGFESAAGWSFFADKVSQPKAAAWYNELSSSNHYGTAIYDGVRRLLLVQTGAAFQDIQIPAPGLYRLVFHAAQRCPLTYGNVYGHNPVRAWLARDGATNVIGWTRVDDNAIVRREFLFNVAVAGTYRFGLQGMSDNSPQYPGTDQNALIDGVSIEPASDLAPADIPLPKNLSINVAEGAYLQLSFASTQKVERVKLGGHFAVGVISQETYPDAIIGPGALYTTPKGSLMMLR